MRISFHIYNLIVLSVMAHCAAISARTFYTQPDVYGYRLQQSNHDNVSRYAGMIAISPVPMPKVNYGIHYKRYAPVIFLAGIITKASIQHIQHDSEEPSDSDQYPTPLLELAASSQARKLAEEYIKIYLFMLSTTNAACKCHLKQDAEQLRKSTEESIPSNFTWLDLATTLKAEITALAAAEATTDADLTSNKTTEIFEHARTAAKAKLADLTAALALEEEARNVKLQSLPIRTKLTALEEQHAVLSAKLELHPRRSQQWLQIKDEIAELKSQQIDTQQEFSRLEFTEYSTLTDKKELISSTYALIDAVEAVKTVRPWSTAAGAVWGKVAAGLVFIRRHIHYGDEAFLSSLAGYAITPEDKQTFEASIDALLSNINERVQEPGDDLVPVNTTTIRLYSQVIPEDNYAYDIDYVVYLRRRNVTYTGERFDKEEPDHHECLSVRQYIKKHGCKLIDSFYYRIIPTDPGIEHKRTDGYTKSLLELKGKWDSYYVSTSTLPPSQKKARRELVERYGLLEVASLRLGNVYAYIVERDDKVFLLSDVNGRSNRFGVSVYHKKPPQNSKFQKRLTAPLAADSPKIDFKRPQDSFVESEAGQVRELKQFMQEYARPCK